jgi:O-antigen ligase
LGGPTVALLAATGVLLAATLFFGGGSDDTRLFWIGSAAVVLAGVATAAALAGFLPGPRLGAPGIAFVALLGAFVAWSGLSIVWSIEGDRSWSYFNRDLAYLAFAIVGVLLGGSGSRMTRVVAAGLAALLAGVVVWALAGKVAPSLGPDVTRTARLRSPIGYWNALAVLADMAVVLGVWLAARRERAAALRAAGVVLAYASVVALGLTLSRGGIAVGAVALLAFVVLAGPLLETAAALAAALVPAGALVAWASTRPALVDPGVSHAERVHDGRVFGVLLLLGAAIAFGAAFAAARLEAERPLSPERRRLFGRWTIAVAGGAAAVVLLALVVRAGGPVDWTRARVHEFANPVTTSVTQAPGRLGAASSNHRWTWWRQAWHTFRDEPIKGTGAGSFDLAHRLYRTTYAPPTREPHDLPLQVASETGAIGFVLLFGALAAGGLAGWKTLRVLAGDERAAAAAIAACLVAYAVHVLVDIGWDYVAVSATAFLLVGLLASAGRPAAPARRRSLAALAVLALAAAGLSSLATPWLADRKVDNAFNALASGDVARAAADAKRANALNPLSLEALDTWALAEQLRGQRVKAGRLYVDAVELQRKNPDAWYALGFYEASVLHDCLNGYRALNRSYTLDRFGPAGVPGGPLDQTRAAVNAGRRRCSVS